MKEKTPKCELPGGYKCSCSPGAATHTMHLSARGALASLRRQGEELCIVPQNLIEFWAAAARPFERNGLGLTVDETARESRKLKRLFHLLYDLPAIFTEWEKDVVRYRVMGKLTHDARLVAAMKVHNLTHILTFNADDFKRFADITVVEPAGVK